MKPLVNRRDYISGEGKDVTFWSVPRRIAVDDVMGALQMRWRRRGHGTNNTWISAAYYKATINGVSDTCPERGGRGDTT